MTRYLAIAFWWGLKALEVSAIVWLAQLGNPLWKILLLVGLVYAVWIYLSQVLRYAAGRIQVHRMKALTKKMAASVEAAPECLKAKGKASLEALQIMTHLADLNSKAELHKTDVSSAWDRLRELQAVVGDGSDAA